MTNKTKNYKQIIIDYKRYYDVWLSEAIARSLVRLGARIQRQQTRQCNGVYGEYPNCRDYKWLDSLHEDFEAKLEREDVLIDAMLDKIKLLYNIEGVRGGDPRGCVLKIKPVGCKLERHGDTWSQDGVFIA